ncbi:hypothetical protein RRG08_030163 [Elysia crispata]|uniref:Uncharacterized protein n=1 Tax=Elysia crispata TaxID=231223 RepID=A0AAE0ZS82_9GAST|nr:hypothetical protein RRG08_030163 [Elysia crispata]
MATAGEVSLPREYFWAYENTELVAARAQSSQDLSYGSSYRKESKKLNKKKKVHKAVPKSRHYLSAVDRCHVKHVRGDKHKRLLAPTIFMASEKHDKGRQSAAYQDSNLADVPMVALACSETTRAWTGTFRIQPAWSGLRLQLARQAL